jgi:hypothetical protein
MRVIVIRCLQLPIVRVIISVVQVCHILTGFALIQLVVPAAPATTSIVPMLVALPLLVMAALRAVIMVLRIATMVNVPMAAAVMIVMEEYVTRIVAKVIAVVRQEKVPVTAAIYVPVTILGRNGWIMGFVLWDVPVVFVIHHHLRILRCRPGRCAKEMLTSIIFVRVDRVIVRMSVIH